MKQFRAWVDAGKPETCGDLIERLSGRAAARQAAGERDGRRLATATRLDVGDMPFVLAE